MAKKKNVVQIQKVKKIKTEILLREFEEKEIGEIVENQGRRENGKINIRKTWTTYKLNTIGDFS